MATAGSIVLDLLMRTGSFETDTKRAEQRLREMERTAKQWGVGLAASAAAATTAVAALTVRLADQAQQLERFSTLANSSAEDFQRWAYASNRVGIEQEKLSDILKDVQDRVGDFLQTGGGPMADFFENIAPKVGVTIEQFRRLSGQEALGLYVKSLERANISQSEMVFHMEAMASDSSLLLPLLRDNARGMQELGEEAERLGAVLDDETIAASAEFGRNLEQLKTVSSGLANELVSSLVPALNSVTQNFLAARKSGAGLLQSLTATFEGALASGDSASLFKEQNDLLDRIEKFEGAIAKGGAWTNVYESGLANARARLAAVQAQLNALDTGDNWDRPTFTMPPIPVLSDPPSHTKRSSGTDPLASYRARLVEAQALTAELQKYGLAVDDMLPSERELLKLQGQMTLAVSERVGKTSDATLSAQIALTQEAVAQEKLAKQLRQTLEFRQQYTDSILDENAGLYESILSLQDQTAAFALTEDESARNAERLLQSRLALRIAKEEELLATQRLNGASQEEIATTEQALAGLRTQLEYRQKMAELGDTVRQQMEERRAFERTVSSWTDTVREIDDVFREGFAGMVNEGMDAWDAMGQSMVTTFKTTVADTLYKAFAQPFVVRVVAQMAGLIGGDAVGQEVLRQSGLSNNVASLADSASKLNTLYGTVSQAMTGASVGASAASLGYANIVGAVGGDAIGALIAANGGWAGVGAAAGTAGATAGAAAGASAGASAATGAMGSVMGAIGAAAPWIAAGLAVYSMFGDKFAAEARYGGTYTYRPGQGTERPGWAAGDAGPQAMQFADSLLSSAADAVQRAFAGTGSDVILKAFEASFESSEKGRGGTHSGGTLVIDGHEISFGTSKKGQGHGGTSGTLEEMMKAAEVDTWQTVIQAWQAAIDVFPSMMQDMIRGVDADALGLEAAQALAQQFVAVIEQINALSAALGSLPFVPVTAQTFEFAAALAQASGGAENAANLVAGFYQGYFTEAERMAHLMGQLTEQFAEMGFEVPRTREEMRDLVQANMALGEAGARTAAKLLGLGDSLLTLIAYTEQASQAATQAAEAQRQAAQKALDAAQQAAYDAAVAARQAAERGATDAMAILTNAVNREKSALQQAYDEVAEALNAAISASQTALGNLESLAGRLQSTLHTMRGQTDAAMNRAAAQAQIERALSVAQLTGVMPSGRDFESALQVVAQPSEGLFGSFEEYQLDFLKTANDISLLNELTGEQISVEEQTLQTLKDQLAFETSQFEQQMAYYDQVLETAQAQLEEAMGTKLAVMSVEDAIANLASALATLKATPVPSAPSEAGKGGYINDLYRDLFGRDAEQAGIDYWTGRVEAGMSVEDLERAIREAARNEDKGKVLRGFDVGTSYVPYDMSADIHQGEIIIDRRSSDILRQYGIGVQAQGGGNTGALERRIDELVADNRKLVQYNYQMLKELMRIKNNTEDSATAMRSNGTSNDAVLVF